MLEYELSVLEQSHSELIIANKSIFAEPSNESSEIYVLEICQDNDVIKKYRIADKDFNVFSDGEQIILIHPLWSLSGKGKTLAEAEKNLFKDAKEVLDHYKGFSKLDLTEDAIKMQAFLQKILYGSKR